MKPEEATMTRLLYVLAAMFVALWLLGFALKFFLSPLFHGLLVAAAVVAVLAYLSTQGRPSVR